MPGKKTMEQAKKLKMKNASGYKVGKKVKMQMGMSVPSYNDMVKKKTGGKV
tara:strand:- start:394 stop:546 length:153 start_codon:yes stop_codon:yes gene_type:complete